MYRVPLSKGHRPPREGSDVGLDTVELEAVVLEDPVGMLEDGPDMGDVELEIDDAEPKDSVVKALDRVPVVDDTLGDAETVELVETEEALEEDVDPKATLEVRGGDRSAVLLAGEGIEAVLLGDSVTLVLDEVIPLEAGAVVVLAPEVSTVTVVVTSTEAVPDIVPSL